MNLTCTYFPIIFLLLNFLVPIQLILIYFRQRNET